MCAMLGHRGILVYMAKPEPLVNPTFDFQEGRKEENAYSWSGLAKIGK